MGWGGCIPLSTHRQPRGCAVCWAWGAWAPTATWILRQGMTHAGEGTECPRHTLAGYLPSLARPDQARGHKKSPRPYSPGLLMGGGEEPRSPRHTHATVYRPGFLTRGAPDPLLGPGGLCQAPCCLPPR